MDLKEQLDNISIIDGHVHAYELFYWLEAVGSYPFINAIAKLPKPNQITTLHRRNLLFRAYRELYNFPYSTLTPEKESELDELYEKSKKDESEIYKIVMDQVRIEANIQMCLSKPELPPQLNEKQFKKASLVDGFMIPLDNTSIKNRFPERASKFIAMCEYFPKKVRGQSDLTFDGYLNLITSTLEDLLKGGIVALKMNFAYWREITVDAVEEDEARNIYEAKDTSPIRYKRLQDFLLRHIIRSAIKLDLPIQIHMGATSIPHAMEESNPSHIDSFLYLPDIRRAKIVILHGAYPYWREAGFMASRWVMLPGYSWIAP
jgi:hypothetical protein